MTSDVSKKKTVAASGQDVISGKKNPQPRSASDIINKKTVSHDRRVTGYTRVKSGELRRRPASRTPDMSNPNARVVNPGVSIGSLTTAKRERTAALPAVRTEPTVRTISDTKKQAFPFSIVFMSLICSVLFMYMIFNYVKINEHTSAVSDLKKEIATLSAEKDDLTAKLDRKNDLTYIEKVAKEQLGMVKIDEIIKKYVTMDPDDVITSFGKNTGTSSAD